jgi:hypothetical protein
MPVLKNHKLTILLDIRSINPLKLNQSKEELLNHKMLKEMYPQLRV